MGSKIKRPVFFIGCGRSGTTWLSSVLASHPHIAVYPTEANELWHPRSYPWHTAVLDTPTFWSDGTTFTRLSLGVRQPEDDLRLMAHFGAYQFLSGGKVFLNKSVMVTFMIPYILTLFPSAKFLHMVRDGRAVALSYAVKEKKKIDQYVQYDQKGFNLPMDALLEKFATHWQDHLLEIDRQKKVSKLNESGRLLEFSYESLCEDTRTIIDKIAGFLDISPHLFDSTQAKLVKNMNYKYREGLDSKTIQSLTKLIAPTLEMHGYKE